MRKASEAKKEEIYRYLAEQCDQSGKYRASIGTIIQELGFGSVPTITKYLADLQTEGRIRIKSGRPATYELVDGIPFDDDSEGGDVLNERLDAIVDSLSEVSRMVEALRAEVRELRKFKSSLNEIHRTRFEVLYRQELSDSGNGLQPVPAREGYGA